MKTFKKDTTETKLKQEIIYFLRAIGGWATSVNSGSLLLPYTRKDGRRLQRRIKMADRGTPDILASVSGRFIAIECKRDAREIEKWWRVRDNPNSSDDRAIAQHHQRESLISAGATWLIASSLHDVREGLKDLIPYEQNV